MEDITRRDLLMAGVTLSVMAVLPLEKLLVVSEPEPAPVRDYTHVLDRITLEESIGMERDLYGQYGVRDCLVGRLRIRRVKPYCEAREGPRKGNISMTVVYDSMFTWDEAVRFSGVNPDNVDVRPEAIDPSLMTKQGVGGST